jgi:tetratricopeptide (TPR) repeat protein
MIVVFGLVYFGHRLYAPKSKADAVLTQIEPLVRQARYNEAVAIVENALKELPNRETYVPAVIVYGTMGRFDDAEQHILALRREGSEGITEYNKDLKQSILGMSFGLQAHMNLFKDDIDASEADLKRAATLLGKQTFAELNTAAHIHLLRGKATEAMSAIATAEASYRANKKPTSAYHRALKAWALAMDGQDAAADALMAATIASVPSLDRVDQAEVYLVGGYMARAQRKQAAERRAFEKAIALDPEGACGMVARRELGRTAA